eukprot:3314010-Prymnesium_polylepis.1
MVTQAPLVDDATVSIFPACACDNFVNGWSETDIGSEGCARNVVHGLQGVQRTCKPPIRPYVPHLDDGCTSDSFRCIVTVTAVTFPTCVCDTFVNQAYKGMPNGLCKKKGTGVCMARYYVGDKDIGGWEYYGCPEDAFHCV